MTRLHAPEGPQYEAIDFGHAFYEVKERDPAKLAVIDEAHEWTWAQFGDLATRIAGRLNRMGVGRGDRIAVLAENSAPYLALYAGILCAGACVVPLPFSAQPETLKIMFADCGATVLFTSDRYADVAETLGAGEVIRLEGIDAWAEGAPLPEPVRVKPDDFFDLIYSSGTTGTPKGIIHDHRFRSRQLVRMPRFGLDENAVSILSTPLYSNTTLVSALPVIARGGTLVSMAKFDVEQFLNLSQKHHVTHGMLVPVQYMRIMKHPDFDKYDLTSWRVKLSTSAPLPGPLIADVLERWPGDLFEVYGMTEGGLTTVLDARANPTKLDTVGKVAEGCEARIIDEDGHELPAGSYGEIVGRGGPMMQGYLNADEKTQESRWVSPEGWDFIRTGDMGRFDEDGFLHLLDRRKDMIISGGFNIYAADLEKVLRAHPDVADVAVIAIPSEDWGETPLGLVVPQTAGVDADAIRTWANAQLGKTQRLSAIELRDDLPRSEIGKILKKELRAPYWEKTKA
ncbi:class I adenylate-forming enzyme family protein [Rhodalgimonas zhirmunskyi]|uniref:Acyl--CoA ligase n=1 Tax=Rhodalgimonas zhirmunskyi TaxID=2964767 RepID=A0AAJ1U3T1_9RHOB|nr:class I adenylate-forming enzyme family protein [Rhodoalgimonas zhirmunskyi]MDQ2092705.1 acyl--CoA ligase [Rhodoalgimonas zhirmunskyi]